MQKINVKVQKILPWAQIPQYDTSNSAGCDIAVAIQNDTILYPGEFKSYSTGIAMKIEPGYEAQLRSRAGMAKKGLIVANAPATIDCEHVVELTVLLANISDRPIKISPGQKVAQMVFAPIVHAEFEC